MGGVRVDGDSQMSTVPGLFAAGEVAASLHGANRLGGNSLSDLLVFGKRAGEYAATFAKEHPAVPPDGGEVSEAVRAASAPLERPAGENPYKVQQDLQEMMQDLAGIVRRQEEMERALAALDQLEARAARAGAAGGRAYNPAWHTALDLRHLLTVSRAIVLSALARKESRGGHFREDFPEKSPHYGAVNFVAARAADGSMAVRQEAVPPMRPELKRIVEEMK
jgi:succinate dehydrogenase / fumarate reductase flavoprotein subunit